VARVVPSFAPLPGTPSVLSFAAMAIGVAQQNALLTLIGHHGALGEDVPKHAAEESKPDQEIAIQPKMVEVLQFVGLRRQHQDHATP